MLYFQIISQYQTLRRISFDLELWESILESIQQAMLVDQIVKRVPIPRHFLKLIRILKKLWRSRIQ
ncbi:hypothetical protein RYX36_006688, partial [Vicia faba]